MLEKLSTIAANLSAIDLERESLQALASEEQALLDLNREQLQDSIDREGEFLGFYASIAYANLKGRDTVDLKLTGDFYRSFFADTSKYPVIFGARDEKTEELTQRYGEEIFGTTKGNTEKAADEIVLPRCKDAILEAIRV